MGCWDETCGLTNTPIFEGNPVVMVVFEQSVESKRLNEGWSFADQVIAIHKGAYNNYGSVDDLQIACRAFAVIFFHRDVWDACIPRVQEYNAGPANAWRKMVGKPEIPDLGEFVAVLNVARPARRDVLSGLKFRGQQERGDYDPYFFVLKLARKHLPGQRVKRGPAPP
jgi:hypothetical protein